MYLWPKEKPEKLRSPQDNMWHFKLLKENEFEIKNLGYDESLYVDTNFWVRGQHLIRI